MRRLLLKISPILLCLLLVWGCHASYPAKTLIPQIKTIMSQEYQLDVSATIVGKTLYVTLVLDNLVDQESMSFHKKNFEKIGDALTVMRRTILSTDAKINFIVLVAKDSTIKGLEYRTTEKIQDIKEAMLERISRGEFFMRSVRDIDFNPPSEKETVLHVNQFEDISEQEFIAMQTIYRAKQLWSRIPSLIDQFDLRSSRWSVDNNVIRLEFEFIRRRYDLSTEPVPSPLDFVKMTTALVVKNYNFTEFSAIEIIDTFSQKTIRITPQDIPAIKIDLPNINL